MAAHSLYVLGIIISSTIQVSLWHWKYAVRTRVLHSKIAELISSMQQAARANIIQFHTQTPTNLCIPILSFPSSHLEKPAQNGLLSTIGVIIQRRIERVIRVSGTESKFRSQSSGKGERGNLEARRIDSLADTRPLGQF